MNGMAEVIAAHHGYRFKFEVKDVEDAVSCDCGQPMVLSDHAAHIAEELSKAGYGKLEDSL